MIWNKIQFNTVFFKEKYIYYLFAHWYLIRTKFYTRGLNLEYYILYYIILHKSKQQF